MPRPLSNDLRERIVEAIEGGESCHAAAERFDVAPSSAIKLMQAWRATGSLAPKRMGGYRPYVLRDHKDEVVELVKARPDATLDELTEALNKKKISVSRSAVNRFLIAMGLSFKKNAARQRTESA